MTIGHCHVKNIVKYYDTILMHEGPGLYHLWVQSIQPFSYHSGFLQRILNSEIFVMIIRGCMSTLAWMIATTTDMRRFLFSPVMFHQDKSNVAPCLQVGTRVHVTLVCSHQIQHTLDHSIHNCVVFETEFLHPYGLFHYIFSTNMNAHIS